ncbi:MAG: O-methyltransferase [Cryomorphaceae bacterium]
MNFLKKEIEDYAESHTTPESDLLNRINRETHLKVLQPRMLSGHYQGRVLSMFSRMLNPKNILEVGTYTGYSAICLAEGLAKDGRIDTIDINEELEPMVSQYFKESGYSHQIHFHIGNALDIIPKLNRRYDLVFIDADKENYSAYWDAVFEKVQIGGYIIADNVLWSGKVIDPVEIDSDRDTQSLVAYNEMVQNDGRVENILLPVRDGLLIARKIAG